MTEIRFTHDSVMKHRPDPSMNLENFEKDEIKKGSTIQVAAINPEVERGHIFVTLSQEPKSQYKTVDGKNSVYLFLDHLDYQPPDVSAPNVVSSIGDYHLCDEGIKLVKHYEGLRLKCYKCSSGIPTLGIGSCTWFDGKPVRMGQTCTEEEAVKRFKQDVVRFENGVKQGVTVSLTQGAFSALVSFAYNCGTAAFLDSTLLRKINAGDENAARDELKRWTNNSLAGLVARRASETHLYYTGEFKAFN